MKQKDIVLIIVVIFISAVFSIVLSGAIISNPKSRSQKVEVVEKISSEFPSPNAKYFNDKSIDPTQLIRIGDNTNTTPFNTKAKP
jgi:hypothetical protein